MTTKRGPISSPMEFIPGANSTTPDGDCTYDGVDGYEKGSGGKLKEVTFVKEGVFGRIPQAD